MARISGWFEAVSWARDDVGRYPPVASVCRCDCDFQIVSAAKESEPSNAPRTNLKASEAMAKSLGQRSVSLAGLGA
jgi:hypothetical protein